MKRWYLPFKNKCRATILRLEKGLFFDSWEQLICYAYAQVASTLRGGSAFEPGILKRTFILLWSIYSEEYILFSMLINFTFCSKNKHSSLEMSGSCKIEDPMNGVLSHENTTRVWSDLCAISRGVLKYLLWSGREIQDLDLTQIWLDYWRNTSLMSDMFLVCMLLVKSVVRPFGHGPNKPTAATMANTVPHTMMVYW